MVRQKREFKVVDARTGEDITHNVLTQIIMDEESRGQTLLPVSFLRQLIGLYGGGQMQSMLPQYLEASLEAFQQGQSQMREVLGSAFTANPFAELARRNMEMFQSAAGAARPSAAPPPGPAPAAHSGREAEIERLRAELADLQAKVEKLTR
jgi:polyhydroxyalkanoate synthesis repressor PhaR